MRRRQFTAIVGNMSCSMQPEMFTAGNACRRRGHECNKRAAVAYPEAVERIRRLTGCTISDLTAKYAFRAGCDERSRKLRLREVYSS